ncbi:dipeptide ABC transporter ATP-binding protein [Comamonas sp. GB3 AK4-5]|uniref:dipeptide ABC transporter ATP-binding protein n=1 Tax=Comamonas sp. GB3 AK4-5 TaxID=3231487 RepID=UPI00351F7517
MGPQADALSPPPVLVVDKLAVELCTHGAPRKILTDIGFSIASNAVLGIIGESASGKTVLSRALVNALRAPLQISGGQVRYRGKDLLQCTPAEMRQLRGREIAYIGANPGSALDPTLPVGHQIQEKLLAVSPGMEKKAAKRRVIEVLDAVRIPSAAKRFDEYPFQFSGGMLQRALIVDALVSNPRLLIADNITQSLDVTVAAQILRLLKELQQDFHTAIVFVSSLLGIVRDIADQVIVLDQGRIVERAPIARLIEQPEHAYTRALLERVPRIWGVQAPPKAVLGETILDVRAVVKSYAVRNQRALFATQKIQAVRGVSFSVRKGENVGIIGESGCGKSTLSRLLSCLESPDSGAVFFEDTHLGALRGRELLHMRRRFQLLLQDPYNAIAPHATIGRTISEPLRIHSPLRGQALRQRVMAQMVEVGLSPELFDSLPVGLSAGQRQRVNIARALMLEPELLILDETLSALDQVEQAKLLDLFKQLQARRGITYVFISHDLAMVRRVCSRIAVMYLGRIVELADNDAIFSRSCHPYTRALLSAAPSIEAKPYRTETYLLEGEPPDPIQIPQGCSFRTRCPFAMAQCAEVDPILRPVQGEGLVACHLDAARMPDARNMPGTQPHTHAPPSAARNYTPPMA